MSKICCGGCRRIPRPSKSRERRRSRKGHCLTPLRIPSVISGPARRTRTALHSIWVAALRLETMAVRVEQIEGLRVVEFRDEIENDTWTSYITIPRADVLVVATDRAYLE